MFKTFLYRPVWLPLPITASLLMSDEIFTLVSYQLPERITLCHEIAADLHWSLPENEQRRTLLKLILNSY